MSAFHLHRRGSFRRRSSERGFILVIGLLFMLVLLLLAGAMFRSFTMQDAIAGNTREKERSFEVAQSALQYGESWLGQGGAAAASAWQQNCASVLGSPAVCSNALSNAAGSLNSWSSWFNYARTDMSVQAGGGVNQSTGDIYYQAQPRLYISYISTTQDSQGNLSSLYQVTAAGYGGSSETTSVVQSTVRLQSGVINGGGP